jgi:hypothetical protein
MIKHLFHRNRFITNYNCTLDTVSELFSVEEDMHLKNHTLKIQLSTCKRCMTPLCLQGHLIWCILNADASGGTEKKSLTHQMLYFCSDACWRMLEQWYHPVVVSWTGQPVSRIMFGSRGGLLDVLARPGSSTQ